MKVATRCQKGLGFFRLGKWRRRVMFVGLVLLMIGIRWMVTDSPALTRKHHDINPSIKVVSYSDQPVSNHELKELWPDTTSRWLVLPVVFHLHQSRQWRSPNSLAAVLAETQRIFNQAQIELDLSFVNTEEATPAIDVYLVPQVWYRGRRINGISYPWNQKEIYVRDNVVLRNVSDQRPLGPIPLPTYWQKLGIHTPIQVNRNDAEQARTIAHEITHQLGLDHRPEGLFLQASGTTGWQLDDAEISTMRVIAQRWLR